ncbi:restriction endonuclease subunit S [Enterobacter kobei]|uniref:Restriction endonuclease subunit S n=1 Tax=Enterobacter kobei TaxID=208224 RepID=A0AAW3XKT6_9ENTR|nr:MULTISPECIES: restriction endonuclease subunit S [Enterobacterales]EFU3942110.1 restriction endonuclease subunit S [Escherichia coli]EHR3335085.1 restriction endonuclease subunit S [Salmonella enterica subsp. enterica serovar Senftenberg]HAS1940274.1 restriction endonuclease subunit S [Enterobacter asburiae]HBV3680850.1 restriction endonuclease subunit S [Klebsiella pneumoniae]HDC4812008.1 restriction endonuclease subunit S [Enterobacter cloacae]
MDFDEYSFADLLSNIVDNRGKTCPVEDKGFPLIATNCIKDDSLYPVFEKVRFVSDDTYKNWFRGHPNAGDIIFVCKGSPGRVAWVKEPVSFCIAQDMVAIRADQRLVDPMFLFSLLRSEQVINKINNMHVGTLIPHFKKGDFKNLYLSIPRNLKIQRAIGLFYFSLSEKIEKNKEINQTLEQMAQALFKSWFVNFEPVKAKMAVLEAGGSQEDATLAAMTAISGKNADALAVFEREHPEQYAELKATAELFPLAMQDSELGEIPEGWTLSEIGAQIDIAGGATPSTKTPDFWDNGDIHWTTPKDLSNVKDKILLHTERKITKAGLGKISSGLLPVNTVLMSSRAPVGYLAIAKVPVAINQGYIAMKCNKELSPEFVLQWCSANMPEIISRASGTTFAEISKKNFNPIPLVKPPLELVKNYTKQVSAIYSLIENTMRENNSLTELRDTLLPKLLSGEITLPEAEQIISEEA